MKMLLRKNILLLLVILPISIYSQNKFTVGLHYSQDLNFSGYTETPKIGITVGLLPEYSFSKRFGIVSGFLFSSKGYEGHPLVTLEDLPGSLSPVAPCEYCPYTIANFRLFEIPLLFKAIIVYKPKWKLYTMLGTSAYFTFREIYEYAVPDNIRFIMAIPPYKPKISFLNPYFGIINLKIGLEHQLSNKLNLRYGPNVKLSLTDVGANHKRLHTVGLEVNLLYNFSNPSSLLD